MSLKQTIKTKICLVNITPNYPLTYFVKWAESIDKQVILFYLEEIQQELDEEDLRLRQAGDSSPHQLLHSYWCFYCAQARAYYRAVLRDPSCADYLAFLL